MNKLEIPRLYIDGKRIVHEVELGVTEDYILVTYALTSDNVAKISDILNRQSVNVAVSLGDGSNPVSVIENGVPTISRMEGIMHEVNEIGIKFKRT